MLPAVTLELEHAVMSCESCLARGTSVLAYRNADSMPSAFLDITSSVPYALRSTYGMKMLES